MEEDMGDMPRTGSIITTNASAPLYDRWSEMMTRLQLWVEVSRFYVFSTCFFLFLRVSYVFERVWLDLVFNACSWATLSAAVSARLRALIIFLSIMSV